MNTSDRALPAAWERVAERIEYVHPGSGGERLARRAMAAGLEPDRAVLAFGLKGACLIFRPRDEHDAFVLVGRTGIRRRVPIDSSGRSPMAYEPAEVWSVARSAKTRAAA